ncbi:hypothetical protein F0562_022653, partial [Nyssa sinensis]
WEIDSDASL